MSTAPEDHSQQVSDADKEARTSVEGGGWVREETTELAAQWLQERGMDPCNPAHMQELLMSLNDEDDDEDDDDDAVEHDVDGHAHDSRDDERGDKHQLAHSCLPPAAPQDCGVRSAWTQLPSAVTWTHCLHSLPCMQGATSGGNEAGGSGQVGRAETAKDACEGGSRLSHTSAQQGVDGHVDDTNASGVLEANIARWAQVNAFVKVEDTSVEMQTLDMTAAD